MQLILGRGGSLQAIIVLSLEQHFQVLNFLLEPCYFSARLLQLQRLSLFTVALGVAAMTGPSLAVGAGQVVVALDAKHPTIVARFSHLPSLLAMRNVRDSIYIRRTLHGPGLEVCITISI